MEREGDTEDVEDVIDDGGMETEVDALTDHAVTDDAAIGGDQDADGDDAEGEDDAGGEDAKLVREVVKRSTPQRKSLFTIEIPSFDFTGKS